MQVNVLAMRKNGSYYLYQPDARIYNEEERKLLSLPIKYGGLAIPIFHEQAEVEYNNSRIITTEQISHSLITVQPMEYMVDELAIKKIELEIKNEKENTYKMSWNILKIT